MLMWLWLLLVASNVRAGDAGSISESQLIGKWMGHRHLTEFLPNHALRWDDYTNPRMTWHLKGRIVTEFFPTVSEEVSMYYTPGRRHFTIISLTNEKLVGLNENGYKFVEYRVVNDTQEERERAATRATDDQDKLKAGNK
jgi:hypothetical protein